MVVARALFKNIVQLLMALFIVVLFSYVVLIAVNWHDEQPSADSQLLREVLQRTAQVPDETNGFWFYHRHPFQQPLSNELTEILNRCDLENCAAVLAEVQPKLDVILAQHAPLLNFYAQIRLFEHWQQPIPETAAGLTLYQRLTNAQRVVLLQTWKLAQRGEFDEARSLLQQDLAFWRHILRSSNLLIEKTVAASVIKRHFGMANVLQQTLPAEHYILIVPESWATPFSNDELEMLPVYAGEWKYAGNMMASSTLEDELTHPESNFTDKLLYSMLYKPLFLQQATANDMASYFMACAEQATPSVVADKPWYSWMYNPVGKLLNANTASYCDHYNAQINQLEQLRRNVFSS